MDDPSTARDARLEAMLREFSDVLDEAIAPMQAMDLARMDRLTARQDDLRREMASAGLGAGPGAADPRLVAEVRRKLLRNRMMVAHILDFSARLQEHLASRSAGGYDADGRQTVDGEPGSLIDSSV